jgi:predicted DNA-binding transcriptional regulator YafY
MAVRQLASTGDYTLTYDAIVAIRKILTNAPTEYRQFLNVTLDEEVLQAGFGCDAGILSDLWRACQEHQRVIITHDSGEGSQQWLVDPYQILFKRRALYLDACVVSERRVRLFRINRIERVDFQGIRVPTPLVAYNFRERHRHSFSVFVGEQVQRVRIRFFPDAKMRQFINETRWHHSQQIEELPDGGFIFQVDVSEPREVGWWARQWGANAEVLEPVSLRQEMAETARRLGGIYGRE